MYIICRIERSGKCDLVVTNCLKKEKCPYSSVKQLENIYIIQQKQQLNSCIFQKQSYSNPTRALKGLNGSL